MLCSVHQAIRFYVLQVTLLRILSYSLPAALRTQLTAKTIWILSAARDHIFAPPSTKLVERCAAKPRCRSLSRCVVEPELHVRTVFVRMYVMQVNFNTAPRKMEFKLDLELRKAIHYSETKISDQVLQNELRVLEFRTFGKQWMISRNVSPDAFVQVAMCTAYVHFAGADKARGSATACLYACTCDCLRKCVSMT